MVHPCHSYFAIQGVCPPLCQHLMGSFYNLPTSDRKFCSNSTCTLSLTSSLCCHSIDFSADLSLSQSWLHVTIGFSLIMTPLYRFSELCFTFMYFLTIQITSCRSFYSYNRRPLFYCLLRTGYSPNVGMIRQPSYVFYTYLVLDQRVAILVGEFSG